jgi:hypothetical protein
LVLQTWKVEQALFAAQLEAVADQFEKPTVQGIAGDGNPKGIETVMASGLAG